MRVLEKAMDRRLYATLVGFGSTGPKADGFINFWHPVKQ